MSRPATEAEWVDATRLVAAWIAQEEAAVPRRFAGAVVDLRTDGLVVQFPDSEDLRVARDGTIPIWSAEAKTVASSRLLVGVMLCLQYACSAATFQLSSEKRGGWSSAAEALSSVWDGSRALRTMTPAGVKADTLIYIDAGANAALLRDYFREALELDALALPDSAFLDAPLV